MNDKYIDPLFINLTISHSQFEIIYVKLAYKYSEIYNIFIDKEII